MDLASESGYGLHSVRSVGLTFMECLLLCLGGEGRLGHNLV